MSKWWIAGGAGVVALIGLLVWSRSTGASSDMLKMNLTTDQKKFYDKGFKEGSAQGSLDRGKPHDPQVTLNEAEMSLPKEVSWAMVSALSGDKKADYIRQVQISYENGVNDGYERQWVGPSPVIVSTDVVAPKPTSGGMLPGETADHYGYRRGKSTGFDAGYAMDSSATPDDFLASDGSKTRQIESGDPEAYKAGYRRGFAEGFGAGVAQKTVEGITLAGVPQAEPLLSVAGIFSIGADARSDSILSIGYVPKSGGTLLSVAGVRVMGVRAPHFAPILDRSRRAPASPPSTPSPPPAPVRRSRLGSPAPESDGMSPHPLWPMES